MTRWPVAFQLSIVKYQLNRSEGLSTYYCVPAGYGKMDGIVLVIDGNRILSYGHLGLGLMESDPKPDDEKNGFTEYSFLVDEMFDTKTYIALKVKNGAIYAPVIMLGGNDSDSLGWYLSTQKVNCQSAAK